MSELERFNTVYEMMVDGVIWEVVGTAYRQRFEGCGKPPIGAGFVVEEDEWEIRDSFQYRTIKKWRFADES